MSTTTSSFSERPWRQSCGAASICPPWHARASSLPVLAPRRRSPHPSSAGPRCTQPRRSTALLCRGGAMGGGRSRGRKTGATPRHGLAGARPASPWAEGRARSATPGKCSTECQQER
jgi:hypothetical protein